MNREKFFLKEIDGKVLDIGCVQGEFHSILGRKKGVHLFGMDVVESSLPDFRKGNMEKIVFGSNEFDCVVAGEVLEHCLNPKKALGESFRVIKPGGCILLSTPNKKSWLNILFKAYEGKSSDTEHPHHKLFELAELKSLLRGAGFFVEKSFVFPYNEVSVSKGHYRNNAFFAVRRIASIFLPNRFREQLVVKAVKPLES